MQSSNSPPPPQRTFGVTEANSSDSEIDGCVEEIRLAGFTVLPDVFPKDELGYLRDRLDSLYDQQAAEVGGEERLEAIGDAHTVRCPLAYDERLLAVAALPQVLALVGRLLGDYFVLMLQNGVLNMPAVGDRQNAGAWHRDLNYQHFVSTRPLSISALFCVDDFSEETGATNVLPGSHLQERFPSENFVAAHGTSVSASAGSVIVFDSMMYHRSGHNRSGRVRRAINHMYTLPFLRQQIDIPRLLGGRYADDPLLRRLLGYDNESDVGVKEFRMKRLARLAQS